MFDYEKIIHIPTKETNLLLQKSIFVVAVSSVIVRFKRHCNRIGELVLHYGIIVCTCTVNGEADFN